MALGKLAYKIDLLANNKSAGALGKFKKDIGGVNNVVTQLGQTLAAAFSVREIVQAANVMIGVENRMNALTGSATETGIAMDHMRRIASDSRSDFDAVAMLYTRLALATEHLGATQRDVADATQTVANTFIIAGSHAQEANNSARQLAQGLASGALRGDELRSVMENNTILTKMLAEGLNMTIGELREFGHAGKLTAETVMPILIKGTRETNEQIMKMPMTLGQAGVALRNNFQFMVGDIQTATKGFSKIADVVKIFATNLDVLLIPALIAATFAVKSLTASMLANPFGLILVALTTAAMAAYIFRNAIADVFAEIIQKKIPILALRFKIFALDVQKSLHEKLITPMKTAFNAFINFIIGKVNLGIDKINGAIDKLPNIIKDTLDVSKLPKIDLLPDVDDKSNDIQAKINTYISEVLKITNTELEKADRPSFTEFLFGKPGEKKDGSGSGFGALTPLELFLNDMHNGYKKFFTGIKTMQEEMQGVFKKSYDGLTNLTMDFLEKGKASFKDYATSVVRELIRIAVQKLIIDRMFASIGGSISSIRDSVQGSLEYDRITSDGDPFTFAGGGYTGNGARSGGVDGKGGFPAILHPRETVVDHAQGQGMGATVNFNISTVDAAGFDELLASRKGLITSIINNAMNNRGRMGVT